jgi:hypothetical protein
LYLVNPVDFASSQFVKCIQELRSGLEPETLSYWYMKIKKICQEIVPEISNDDINFIQDRVLSMKFKINISIRVIPYVLDIIEENIMTMPYSTGLYFRKVQQMLLDSLDKYFIDHYSSGNSIMKKRRARRKTKEGLDEKPKK